MIPHPGGAFTIIDTIDVSGRCLICEGSVSGKLGMRAITVERKPAIDMFACDDRAAHPLSSIHLEALTGVQAIHIQRPKIDPTGRN